MNPNIFASILSSLKGLAFSVVAPIVGAWNSEAGKTLTDIAATFADSKVTADEAAIIAVDGINFAKSLLDVKYHPALDLLSGFVINDVPLITNKIAPDVISIVKAFESIA